MNLLGLALRQANGLALSLLGLSSLHWPVPDYSTLCRRQLCLNVQAFYQRSAAGLHLLVDSTGIKFVEEGAWKCKEHRSERRSKCASCDAAWSHPDSPAAQERSHAQRCGVCIPQ